jgi:flagellar basal body rod protein FlgC
MNGLDQLLDFNAAALRIRAHRQEILAANIANVDTPTGPPLYFVINASNTTRSNLSKPTASTS